MKIYHNPLCRKSRETLQIIQNSGTEVEIIKYLEEVPSEKELTDLLKKLNIPAEKLLRKTEKIFKDQFKGKEFSRKEWIKIMIANPKLIERPIVVQDDKAVLGRPPENVNILL
ncbi:arsenate reductase (glutaredoxin) [Flavobacteriales bacterium]|nr:arsenate reductase (glutaredoxin) [Flavobacteriales bacterium]